MEKRGPHRNPRTDKALERKERERERDTMENTSAKTNGGIRRRIGSKGARKKERRETKERRRTTGGIQRRVVAGRRKAQERCEGRKRKRTHGHRGRRAPIAEVVEVAKDMWSCGGEETERDNGQRAREDRHTRID